MPVNVPDGLPAIDILSKESVFLMTEERAQHQDIRPLEIAILNLMPTKIATETQLLRLLSNTPLQVQASLVSMAGHQSKNTATSHMDAFYVDSREIRESSRRFDGLIVTGAPIETLPFEEVSYWDELVALFEWSRKHVYQSLFICWGANAGLWHFYGVKKHLLTKKLSGIYPMDIYEPNDQLLLGLDDPFFMPQSRYATVLPEDVEPLGLTILAGSPEAGAVITASPNRRQVFVTGHLEYEGDTLDKEYKRDIKAGLDIAPPLNYYLGDDPSQKPLVRWRTYGHQFFANWLNYYVYQETPYRLEEIG
ncbi:MAG: homoserine O-succinyltransferase [Coriobacteriia bacterium]|nr:homoserine O-succinyltransferase [Coriobacteriia bacterium]MCL2750627.1 homoserine O-succinyltransferase [Coriobacteriia bacterium]